MSARVCLGHDRPCRVSRRVSSVAGDTLGAPVEWRPPGRNRVEKPGCAPGVRLGNDRHRRVSRGVSGIGGDALGSLLGWAFDCEAGGHSLGEAIYCIRVLRCRIILHGTG